jgi:hypothetical protein
MVPLFLKDILAGDYPFQTSEISAMYYRYGTWYTWRSTASKGKVRMEIRQVSSGPN